MLEQSIRRPYQQLLVDPLVRQIDHRIQPQHITILAGMLGILFIPAIISDHPLIAIVFLLASGYCDTLDGSLARHQNNSTALGTVMDIMMDRLVELSAVLGLYFVAPDTRAVTTILLLASIVLCITSFLVVAIFTPNDSPKNVSTYPSNQNLGERSEPLQKNFHYSPGLIERAETFCFFVAMILLPEHFNVLAMVLTLLISLTTMIRLTQFARRI